MPLLQVLDICKEFPGVKALQNVNFDLEAGEVHALLGENGAGKSTLVKILTGIYKNDSGTIMLDGQKITLDSPQDAFNRGISVIHQELNLLPEMNVTSNILLGNLPRKSFLVDWKMAQVNRLW